jgi:hypothetical protein
MKTMEDVAAFVAKRLGGEIAILMYVGEAGSDKWTAKIDEVEALYQEAWGPFGEPAKPSAAVRSEMERRGYMVVVCATCEGNGSTLGPFSEQCIHWDLMAAVAIIDQLAFDLRALGEVLPRDRRERAW